MARGRPSFFRRDYAPYFTVETATVNKLRSLGFDINASDFAGIVDKCVQPEPETVDIEYDSTSSAEYLDIYQG